jgi:hypothetical protein
MCDLDTEIAKACSMVSGYLKSMLKHSPVIYFHEREKSWRDCGTLPIWRMMSSSRPSVLQAMAFLEEGSLEGVE